MCKKKQGWCYGKWDGSAVECARCLALVAMKCESITKSKQRAISVVDQAVDESVGVKEEVLPVVDTKAINEYFLEKMEVKFGRPRGKYGSDGELWVYKDVDGKSSISVECTYASGQVHLTTDKIERVVVFGSKEDANELFAEVV